MSLQCHNNNSHVNVSLMVLFSLENNNNNIIVNIPYNFVHIINGTSRSIADMTILLQRRIVCS